MADRPKYQTKVFDRVSAGLQRFAPTLKALSDRSANESDTVLVITDILSEVFGWKRYEEITTELRVKGQFCDLALRQGDRILAMLEAKAVNAKLNRGHLYQAVSYAANRGVDWIILSTGIRWELYRLILEKPLDQQLVAEFRADDPALTDEDYADMEAPWLFCKEAFERNAPQEAADRLAAINGPNLARFLLSAPVLKRLRLEIREQTDFSVGVGELEHLLCKSILRPEVVPQVVRPPESGEASDPAAKSPMVRSSVRLEDVHARGLIRDGEPFFGRYKKQEFTGCFRAPDSVEFNGARYDSLSEAAIRVIQGPNPAVTSWNGWTFWSVDREGKRILLAELRSQVEATGAPPTTL